MDYLVWTINPNLVSLGPLTIRWYGALFATGFICGYFIIRWMYRKENQNPDEVENLLLYVAAGTIIGARLGHCLLYDPGYYLSNPLKILAVWEGGLASHGAVTGVLLVVYFYCRKYSQSFLWLMDRLAIALPLTGSFIRLGNLFNSEILGKATDVPWAIVFKRIDSVPRHPVQVYESISYLLIFAVALLIYKLYAHKAKKGFILGTVIILITVVRFALEYLKMPQAAYSPGMGLNVGQLLSIPFFIAGCALVVISFNKPNKA